MVGVAEVGERKTWLASDRARRAAVAVLLGVGASFVITLASGSGPDTAAGRLGGDYPAFYAAGRVAATQGYEHVNDFGALEEAQRDLFPADEADEGFLMWAYPPHLALLYEPLSAMPYRASYAVHTVLSAALVVLAVALARPMLPWLREAMLPAVAGALAYFPLFRGFSSGQNTALTLVLLVAAWRASSSGRDLLAGVFLGLLLFKPQFAALALLAWLLGGRWRVLPSFVGVAAATWAITAWLAGAGWLGRYLDDVRRFQDAEVINGKNHVSLSEASNAVFGTTAPGWVLAVFALGAAVRVWRSHAAGPLAPSVAVLAPVVLLCAAHAVFYDSGVVLVTAGVLLATRMAWVVGPLWLLGLLDPLKEVLDVNPGVVVLGLWLAAACVAASTHQVRSSSKTEVAYGRRPLMPPAAPDTM